MQTLKTCKRCNEELSINLFYTGYDNRMGKSYSRSMCLHCESKRNRERYLANRDHVLANSKKNHLLRNYGLTQEDFNKMFKDQDGRCAICFKESDRTLHVDHCHDTGKIRKLLCSPCNQAIGLFKEDQVIMASAIEYLSNFSGDRK